MKHYQKKFMLINLIILSVVVFSQSTFANTLTMRTTLKRIDAVLSQTLPLIQLGQKQQTPDSRLQFHFSQLKKDIVKIRRGIHAAHLNFLLRLVAGLLIIVMALFILAGLIKLLEDGQIQERFRFLLYLFSLSFVLMLFF